MPSLSLTLTLALCLPLLEDIVFLSCAWFNALVAVVHLVRIHMYSFMICFLRPWSREGFFPCSHTVVITRSHTTKRDAKAKATLQ